MGMRQRLAVLACLLQAAAVLTAGLGGGALAADPAALADGDRGEIESGLKALTDRIAHLPSDRAEERADAEVFAKGARLGAALRHAVRRRPTWRC